MSGAQAVQAVEQRVAAGEAVRIWDDAGHEYVVAPDGSFIELVDGERLGFGVRDGLAWVRDVFSNKPTAFVGGVARKAAA